MTWSEVRDTYPHQWLLVEAVSARSASGKRLVDQMSVVNTFGDSPSAMRQYLALHADSPNREFYVLHTDRPEVDIDEGVYVGPRLS